MLMFIILGIGLASICLVLYINKNGEHEEENYIKVIRYSNYGFSTKVKCGNQYKFYDFKGRVKQFGIEGCDAFVLKDNVCEHSAYIALEKEKENIIEVPPDTMVWARNISFDKNTNEITTYCSKIPQNLSSFIERPIFEIEQQVKDFEEAVNNNLIDVKDERNCSYIYLNCIVINTDDIEYP